MKWTLSESCASAQEKIIGQMNLWDNEVGEGRLISLRSNYKTRIVRRSQMTTSPTGRSASTTTLARRALSPLVIITTITIVTTGHHHHHQCHDHRPHPPHQSSSIHRHYHHHHHDDHHYQHPHLLISHVHHLPTQSTDKCQGNHSTLTLTRSDKSLR